MKPTRNGIRIGSILEICRLIRITGDNTIIFRGRLSTTPSLRGTSVPYISAAKDDPDVRYYFCCRYMVPVATYLPYLELTRDVEDEDVDGFLANKLTQEDMLVSMRLEAESEARHIYTEKTRKLFLDRCINKMRDKKLTHDKLATLFSTTERAVRDAVSLPKKVARQDGSPQGSPVHGFEHTPEYEAIKKAAYHARVKAHGMKVRCEFVLSDVLPTMYDIQGDSGSHNSIPIVPKVCPVLRIPLDYNMSGDKRALNKVRVWRKTSGPDGMAPLTPDNVIVMSAIAAWAIEGAYAAKKVREALSAEAHKALEEWQGKYGTRTVPREAKIGRPKKVAD